MSPKSPLIDVMVMNGLFFVHFRLWTLRDKNDFQEEEGGGGVEEEERK